MRSINKYLSTVAASILAVGLPSVLGSGMSCNTGDYASNIGAGTGGGYPFCLSKHEQGLLIKKIEVSADKETVRGIRVTWSDGSTGDAGDMNSQFHETWSSSIEWDPVKDHPTQLDLWTTARGSKDGGGIGRIKMTTSNGQFLDVSNDDSRGDPNWTADLSKDGTLLGLEGHGNFAVDRLHFIISNSKLSSQSIVDMELSPSVDELNARESMSDRGFQLEKIDSWDFVNKDLKNPVEFGMKKAIKLSTGTTITKSTSDSFELGQGFSFTASMGIPEVAQTELTTTMDMKWSTTNEAATADSEIREESVEVEGKIKLETGESATCEAFAYSAKTSDVEWHGKVKLSFEDDTALLFDSHGVYTTVGFTKGKIICKKAGKDADVDFVNNAEGLGDREMKVLKNTTPEQPDKPSDEESDEASLGDLIDKLLEGIRGGDSEPSTPSLDAPSGALPPLSDDSSDTPPPPAPETAGAERLPFVDDLANGEPPVVVRRDSKRSEKARPIGAKFRY